MSTTIPDTLATFLDHSGDATLSSDVLQAQRDIRDHYNGRCGQYVTF